MPRGCSTALLIIDMINPMDFPEGERLLRHALPAARVAARLKRRLKSRGVPVIYVNDNFRQWRESFQALVTACSSPDAIGAPLAAALLPEEDDYAILKPQHSAFYNTPLEVLLRELGIRRVILTGVAGEHCVLASAMDAHMRQLQVVVVSDGVASVTPGRNRNALRLLEDLGIRILPGASIRV